MNAVLFVLRLIYRAVVRVERKLDQLILQQQDVAKLAELAGALQRSSDRLKEATEKQGG